MYEKPKGLPLYIRAWHWLLAFKWSFAIIFPLVWILWSAGLQVQPVTPTLSSVQGDTEFSLLEHDLVTFSNTDQVSLWVTSSCPFSLKQGERVEDSSFQRAIPGYAVSDFYEVKGDFEAGTITSTSYCRWTVMQSWRVQDSLSVLIDFSSSGIDFPRTQGNWSGWNIVRVIMVVAFFGLGRLTYSILRSFRG